MDKQGNQYADRWEVGHTVPPVAFDQSAFDAKVDAIKTLLKSEPPTSPIISRLYIYICGDQKSEYCEEVDSSGDTPTLRALRNAFAPTSSSNSGWKFNGTEIIPTVVKADWGRNAGSVTPLNHCMAKAQREEVKKVLIWSPEIALDASMVNAMSEHMNQERLFFVGYLRDFWFHNLSWHFPQNTCTLWNLERLRVTLPQEGELDFFASVCNGDGSKVTYRGADGQMGETNCAGMEEFEKYLRLLKAAKKSAGPTVRDPWGLVPWGMVGMNAPAKWDQSKLNPDAKAQSDIKIARQKLVMDAWVERNFPAIHSEEIYSKMFLDAKFT